MPRSPRLFVEGGIYHVYNRVTRGERAFGEDPEAERLLDAMREVKQRDGLVVLAWCIMSNHYHLAIRCTGVPLWRSMASIHVKVTKGFNARNRVWGPFWQGRYRAKLVEDPEYLRRLLLYVHLNPVAAGVVKKPEQHVWSGHREVVRGLRRPFVDPDQLLLVFGETRRDARRSYLESIRAATGEPWVKGSPGELPWWRFGRPREKDQSEELRIGASTPFIDELGRSAALERPRVNAEDFVERVLGFLGVDLEDVSGRAKRREVVRAREFLMSLGVERYGQRVTALAASLGVRYDTASVWGRRGAHRRRSDPAFQRRLDEVDELLAATPSSRVRHRHDEHERE